ncbi:hypothetical protein Syun_021620 [Stephania yunnanensis]|uniref:FAD/NAD(P)-binding domain-containing protein n=1 Tax=Stephania yunnanensis TaxID=152371 RepID=A0AAP0IG31_9MAGN
MAFDQLAGGEKVAVLIGGELRAHFFPNHSNSMTMSSSSTRKFNFLSLDSISKPSRLFGAITITYDYLVVALGHNAYVPKTMTERLKQYEEENEKIKSVDSILIIGGGPTGVELAGEIVTDFPEKKVTVVHRGSRLLGFIGAKASKKTLDWLVLNIVGFIGAKASATFYSKLSHDIYFLSMLNKKLNIAEKHVQVTAKNIKLLISGGQENKMANYKPGYEIAIVSLGRKDI